MVREQQHDRAKQNAGGMETPGQQQARDEDGGIKERHPGNRQGNPAGFEQGSRSQQDDSSGQKQGFERFDTPEMHRDPFLSSRDLKARGMTGEVQHFANRSIPGSDSERAAV